MGLESRLKAALREGWTAGLAASEIRFRYAGRMVFQLQLAKRIDAAPPPATISSTTSADLLKNGAPRRDLLWVILMAKKT